MLEFKCKPIYGWGWTRSKDQKLLDVPDEFTVKVLGYSDKTVEGIVKGPHEFESKKVKLDVRGVTKTEVFYNVYIYNSQQRAEFTGFAELSGTKNHEKCVKTMAAQIRFRLITKRRIILVVASLLVPTLITAIGAQLEYRDAMPSSFLPALITSLVAVSLGAGVFARIQFSPKVYAIAWVIYAPCLLLLIWIARIFVSCLNGVCF